MADDGRGDSVVVSSEGGGGGGACHKCGEEGHMARECPIGGGGGGNKCRNCRQEGHIASDCPEPEVCRRCPKEGHVKDDCPEPERCYNCRQLGHGTSDCPEPEMCRRCRKPGHEVADCPEPEKCYNCRKQGNSTADCPHPEVCRKEGHRVADCPDPQVCKWCGWLPVENTGIPGWRKGLLPEEKIVRPPDWRPPRVHSSLMRYVKEFSKEEQKLGPSSKTTKNSSTSGNGIPSYRSLITKALQDSKERKGLSRPAIMKYIVGASVTPNTLLLNKMIKKMSDEGKVVPGAAVGKSGAGCFKLSAEERVRLAKDEKVAAKKELVKGKVRDEVKKGPKKVAKKSAPSSKKTGKSLKAVKPGKVKQGSKQEKSTSGKVKKVVGAKSKKVLAPKK